MRSRAMRAPRLRRGCGPGVAVAASSRRHRTKAGHESGSPLLLPEDPMNDPITILGIAGSLRKDSYNKAALRFAQSVCPDGARFELCDIAGLPLFNQDEEKNPTP